MALKSRAFNLLNWIQENKDSLQKKNLEGLIAAGQGRWKIENQGFNQQKIFVIT